MRSIIELRTVCRVSEHREGDYAMLSIQQNSHYGYDVVVGLEGRSVEAFCAQYYLLLVDFVGGLPWRSSEELAHVLSITWNEQAQVITTIVALGRIGQTHLDAYLLNERVVFHCYPDAPDFSWRWQDQLSYIKKLQSSQFQQQQYELAMRLTEVLS
jgi:hypothetical protein